MPGQIVAPDSKPGFCSRFPLGGGVVPPLQLALPAGTEIAVNAFSTAAQVALLAPKSSIAEVMAPSRALR